jgi:hypothetical protein
MTQRAGARRPPAAAPLLLVAALLAIAAPASAQVRDTARVPADTLEQPQDSVAPADTIPPDPLVAMGPTAPARYALGVWSWDREALRRSRHVSVADLIATIPGVVPFRTGLFLQPDVAAVFGATAGAVRIELDGYVLDPLTAPSFDLSRIEVANLERVYVTRRLDGVRIQLHSAESVDARAYSRVEAATGEPNLNIFRGVFLAPRFLVGPLGIAIERIDTDGNVNDEPADAFAAWVKWGITRENRGVQIEYRQTSINRELESPWPAEYRRRDVVLRARNRFTPQLVGELFLGSSNVEHDGPLEEPVPPGPDEPPPEPPVLGDRFERSITQGGARAALTLPSATIDATVRLRDNDRLPAMAIELDGILSPFEDRAFVRGHLDHQRWDGVSTTAWDVAASFDLLPAITVFGELAGGSIGAPAFRPAPDRLPGEENGEDEDGEDGEDEQPDDPPIGTAPIVTEKSGFRAGIEGRLRGITFAAAFVGTEVDSVAPFGVPFDTAFGRFPGAAVRGWELSGRVPLFVPWLTVDGSLLRWTVGPRFLYLPSETWRVGLQAHLLPLESGNLEIITRFEAVGRGATSVFDLEAAPEEAGTVTIEPRTVYNADLVIRILDVLAFLRYEDLSGKDPFDVPGRIVNGPRFYYGVKWHFWN